MSELSRDQLEKRAAIKKSATIWGVVVGVIAGLLALWLLGGQGSALRYGGAIVVAVGAGFLVFRASFASGAKSAKCAKCGATFSLSRNDHKETLTASTNKEERAEQPDQTVKVTTWIEDAFDVVDRYACAKCGDVTTKSYKTTRRRDETSVVETPKAASRAKKEASTTEADTTPTPARSGSTRGRKSR